MSRFAAVVFVLLSVLASVVADVVVPYTWCGTSKDIVTLSNVTANAWPPVHGTDMTINVYGTLSQGVSAGSYEIKVTALGITVLDLKGPLSDIVPNLPLPAGPIAISKTEALSSSIPSGINVNIQVTAVDDQGNELVCLKISTTIKTPNPVHSGVEVGFTPCGSGLKMPVQKITAPTWPPTERDVTYALEITFKVEEEVTAASNPTYESKISYWGIVVQDTTKSLTEAGFTLPINVGTLVQASSLVIPSSAPAGPYSATISASAGSAALFCVEISFEFSG